MAVTGCASGETTPTSETMRVSRDALLGGAVLVEQPARGAGYRVNVDALLLASFARGRSPVGTVFDLGAGVGAIALTLLYAGAARRAVMIELDPQAAELARRNVDANGWSDRADVVCGDVREVAFAHRGQAQLVVCNPPYFEPGRGREPANAARARARSGELAAFVQAARAVAGRRARVCFVYPAGELASLCASMRGAGLEPKRMRAVHATRGAAARVVLVEAQPAKSGGLVVMPPLVEREDGGTTPELASILGAP
jgi:tRNA1Val (adenine37-N6)-methyltransferase